MEILIVGLLLWSLVHLTPSLGIRIKERGIGLLGQGGYALSFALLMATAMALVIFGYRSAPAEPLYVSPEAVRPLSFLLMIPAFMLFIAPQFATRIKRIVRHPQLMGVVLWSVAHLMASGSPRSILLFGGLALWAILEMSCINRRDGAWVKEPAPSWGKEFTGLGVGVAVFAVAGFIHTYVGVPIM